jgi:hypothetical protein
MQLSGLAAKCESDKGLRRVIRVLAAETWRFCQRVRRLAIPQQSIADCIDCPDPGG